MDSQAYIAFVQKNADMLLVFFLMFATAGLTLHAFIVRRRDVATQRKATMMTTGNAKRRRSTPLPAEALLEVLKFLDRENLDVVTLACRRFTAIVRGGTFQLSLRHVSTMTLTIDQDASVTVSVVVKGDSTTAHPTTRSPGSLDEFASAFEDLSANSYMENCAVTCNRTLTAVQWDAFKSALMQAHAIVCLAFDAIDFTDVEAPFFTGLALVRSIQCLKFIDCKLLPQHFTNDTLRNYVARGIHELTIKRNSRALRAFDVTDEGILHFCLNRPNTEGSLAIDGVVVSAKFLKNFCEAAAHESGFIGPTNLTFTDNQEEQDLTGLEEFLRNAEMSENGTTRRKNKLKRIIRAIVDSNKFTAAFA